jgi:hypothetical protein
MTPDPSPKGIAPDKFRKVSIRTTAVETILSDLPISTGAMEMPQSGLDYFGNAALRIRQVYRFITGTGRPR